MVLYDDSLSDYAGGFLSEILEVHRGHDVSNENATFPKVSNGSHFDR